MPLQDHPNFLGWQELVGKKTDETEIILKMPRFLENTAETSVGITLFLMQSSFKGFVTTFEDYLVDFAYQLKEWNDSYSNLIVRYKD